MKSFDYFKTLIDADVIDHIETDLSLGQIVLTIGRDKSIELADRTIVLSVKEYWIKKLDFNGLVKIMKTGDTVKCTFPTALPIYHGIGFMERAYCYQFSLNSQEREECRSYSSYSPDPFFLGEVPEGFKAERNESLAIYTKL